MLVRDLRSRLHESIFGQRHSLFKNFESEAFFSWNNGDLNQWNNKAEEVLMVAEEVLENDDKTT